MLPCGTAVTEQVFQDIAMRGVKDGEHVLARLRPWGTSLPEKLLLGHAVWQNKDGEHVLAWKLP